MRITVRYTQTFSRKFKKYARKFHSLSADLKLFITRIESIKPIDLGGNIYKYRLSVKSKNKGKSGGFRILTFELIVSENEKNVTLLSIYDKCEQAALPKKQITEILKDEGLI